MDHGTLHSPPASRHLLANMPVDKYIAALTTHLNSNVVRPHILTQQNLVCLFARTEPATPTAVKRRRFVPHLSCGRVGNNVCLNLLNFLAARKPEWSRLVIYVTVY